MYGHAISSFSVTYGRDPFFSLNASVTIPEDVYEMTACGTYCCDFTGIVVFGQRLDFMILVVFFNLNDFMIL